MSVREKGHDFGKEMRSKYQDQRVPGPGSYDFEGAVFKLGSKMEPSYGFGSRLMVNTDGYTSSEIEKYRGQELMKTTNRFTLALVAL